MVDRGGTDDGPERGLTEVIGVVLLFGVAVAGAAAIIVSGGVLNEQLTDQITYEQAEQSAKELDGRLQSIVVNPSRESATADFGSGGTTTVGTTGRLTISVRSDDVCTHTLPLDSIRYETESGSELVHQGGGVFRVSESGPTTVMPPAVGYQEGTLSVTTFNVRGVGADGDFTVVENATGTRERTRAVVPQLFAKQGCFRPDQVTVAVESQFPTQWQQHFETEFPDSSDVTRTGTVVRLELDHEELPGAVNDSRNGVVNFTDGDPDNGEVLANGVKVDKGVGNVYNTSTRLLAVENGYNKTVYNVTSTTNTTPLDVVFVIDESCSMRSNGCQSVVNHPSGTPIHEAKDATVQFITELQGDPVNHRVAAVGFPGKHSHANGSYSGPLDPSVTHFGLTNDLGNAKTIINDSGTLDYATPTDAGLRDARELLERNGNSSHKQVIVLLTDGKPTEDQPPSVPHSSDVSYGDSGPDDTTWLNETHATSAADIPVYTVAVGSGADQWVTEKIADETDGEHYFARDASALPHVFDDIYRNVSTTRTPERYIINTPTVVNLTVGPDTVTPWVGATTPTGPGLNDPGTGTLITTNSVADGERLAVDETRVYDCAANTTTGTTLAPPWNASRTYRQTRCDTPGTLNFTASGATVYTNGSDVPTGAAWWWQDGTRNAIPSEYVADVDADPAMDFDLDANQVVGVVEADVNDGGLDGNNVVLLLEVGREPAEVRTDWLITARVGDVRVEG